MPFSEKPKPFAFGKKPQKEKEVKMLHPTYFYVIFKEALTKVLRRLYPPDELKKPKPKTAKHDS